MTMSERGIHPDLLEETHAADGEQAGAPAEEAPQRGRSRSRRSEDPTPSTQDREPASPEAPTDGGAQAAAEPPEWFAQARDAKDPAEAFKLLAKNLPRELLERDEVISGLIGHKADSILKRREQEAVERAKLEAAQNNDLYTLGEMTQRELQQRLQSQQAAQAAGPFMDGVVLFQQQLPEDLQRKVAGKTFGEGKGQSQGVAEYLQFVHDESVKLGVEKELQRRESALRKSVLSEVNGDEPVPERDGGTPGRVREVTDEQIEAMTLREYEALFDENGHPKPGVRHRSTRGIPLTQR